MVLDAVKSGIVHSVHSVNCSAISKIGSMRGKCDCALLSDQLVLTPCHGPGQSKGLEGPFYWYLTKVNEMISRDLTAAPEFPTLDEQWVQMRQNLKMHWE